MELEHRIRRAIASYFIERTRKVYSENPEIKRRINKVIGKGNFIGKGYKQMLDKAVADGEINETEACELLEELDKNELSDKFIEPYIFNLHLEWVMGKEFYEEEYSNYMINLEAGTENPTLGFICQKVLGHMQRKENVVDTLNKKGEEAGIEAAISIGELKTAIRKEYTTAEEFIEGFKAFIKDGSILNKMINNPDSVEKDLFSDKIVEIFLEYFIKDYVRDIYGNGFVKKVI